jgi:gliding motility-associated protein GldM
MAGGKETPRQKMIGMMYLVLTALLALNVSKEILDAFALVDNSLAKTEATLSDKNNATMAEFSAKLASNREKTQPFYDKAEEVSKSAADLVAYIEELKARTISVSHNANSVSYGEGWEAYQVDGHTVRMGMMDEEGDLYIKKPDENQENTALLVGSNPQAPKEGAPPEESDREKLKWTASELKGKLLYFKDYLKSIQVREVTGKNWTVPESIINSLDNIFNYPATTEGENEVSWETKNFYHNPLAAILPLMTKLQVDVQNAKADVLAAMLSGIEGKSYKFTNLRPFVIPFSNYVLRGDTFRAEVLLAAYDGTNPPEIFMNPERWDMQDSSRMTEVNNEMKLDISPEGLGQLKIATNGMPLGDASYKGLIRYQGPLGLEEFDVFVPPFKVAEPALVVSPTKMNVFYRGLPNPVEVSVPGVAQEDLQVSISGGHTLTKDGSGWVVKPGKGKDCKISVSAKMPDGSTQRIGEKEFRVKPIPDPVPVFAGKKPSDNTVPATDMRIAAGVRAEMENFDFDVKVTVTGFSMVFIRDGQVIEKSSSNNRVTSDMKANMDKVKKGQKIYIEKISVAMPDGTTRQVANISLKVV